MKVLVTLLVSALIRRVIRFHLVLQTDMVALILPGNLLCLKKKKTTLAHFHVWLSLDSGTFYHIVVCNDQKFVLWPKSPSAVPCYHTSKSGWNILLGRALNSGKDRTI